MNTISADVCKTTRQVSELLQALRAVKLYLQCRSSQAGWWHVVFQFLAQDEGDSRRGRGGGLVLGKRCEVAF